MSEPSSVLGGNRRVFIGGALGQIVSCRGRYGANYRIRQAQCSVHTGIGAGPAANCQRDRTETAEGPARMIVFEKGLVQCNLAGSPNNIRRHCA